MTFVPYFSLISSKSGPTISGKASTPERVNSENESALAVSGGRMSASEAAQASLLDEAYQAEQWGDDPEAVQRRDGIHAEIASAAQFLQCLAA